LVPVRPVWAAVLVSDGERLAPRLVAQAEDYRVEYNTVHPHEALAWNRPSTSIWAWPTRCSPNFPEIECNFPEIECLPAA
jgi:hypothetical protein